MPRIHSYEFPKLLLAARLYFGTKKRPRHTLTNWMYLSDAERKKRLK